MKKLATGCALAALVAGPAAAQNSDWNFKATLYAWVPGMDVSTGTAHGRIDSSLSGSDVLDNLDFAFMGVFEARNGPWSFIADLLYSDLSLGQPTPFGLAFSEAQVTTKLSALSGYAMYRVYQEPGVQIDLGGGFRAFGLDLGVTLTPGQLPGLSKDESESWVDPLIAARVIVPFNDKWFATAFADFGGTSSDDQTWQALASVGYQFNDRWSVQLGYRYMDIEKEVGGNDTAIALSGPFIGGSYRF